MNQRKIMNKQQNVSSEKIMTSKETGHCELALILPLEVINQYLKNDVIELFKKDIESIEKSLRFIKNVLFLYTNHFYQTCTIVAYKL